MSKLFIFYTHSGLYRHTPTVSTTPYRSILGVWRWCWWGVTWCIWQNIIRQYASGVVYKQYGLYMADCSRNFHHGRRNSEAIRAPCGTKSTKQSWCCWWWNLRFPLSTGCNHGYDRFWWFSSIWGTYRKKSTPYLFTNYYTQPDFTVYFILIIIIYRNLQQCW